MAPRRPVPRAATATIALLAAACSTRSSPPSPEAHDAALSAEIASAAPADAAGSAIEDAAPPAEIADTYTGDIDPNLGVVMRLHREGEKVNGTYFYEGPGVELKLAGTLTDAGAFSVTESDASGVTGSWSGHIVRSGNIVGVWTDPKEEKMRAFQLTPVPRKKGGPAITVKRTVRYKLTPKKRPPPGAAARVCSGEIRFPEILGLANASIEAALNERIQRAQPFAFAPDPCDNAVVATGNFEIHLNRSGILSIALTHAEVSATEPHSSNGGATINVLIDTGEEIRLTHILKLSGMDTVLGLIEPMIEQRIKSTTGASEADVEKVKDALRKGDFLFEEKGLRFIAYNHLPSAMQALDADHGWYLGYDALADALNPASKAVRAWKP